MVSTLASRGSTEGRAPRNAVFFSLSLVSTQGPQLAVLCVEPNCIKFIVSACSSHDPRWVMGRCGRNGRRRKTRCFTRLWLSCRAPGSRESGTGRLALSMEGLGDPQARTGPRTQGSRRHQLFVARACPGTHCQKYLISARTSAWRLRLRVSR